MKLTFIGATACALWACGDATVPGGLDATTAATDAVVDLDAPEPDATEPDATDPTAPDATEPDATDAIEPDATAPDATEPPPNFVFILGEARGWTSTSVQMDEGRPDSESDKFETPNLDALAKDGMTFADFYAPSPRCMPSRASYFTGRSPAALHMTFVPENASDGVATGTLVTPDTVTDLPTSLDTVASLLRRRGYATAHFGKWHAGHTDPTAYGFDASDGPTTNKGPAGQDHPNPAEAFAMTERGLAFIDDAVAAGRPFYLQLSHYGGTDAIDARPETYAAAAARLVGAKDKDIADAAVIADMDTTIGTVLAHLDALHVAGRTYVFFSADHGRAGKDANSPLYQGKGSVWEGGIRVPLIVRGPGIPPGEHTRVRASQVDLLPTLVALAGAGPLPAGLEGGSLVDVWTRGSGSVARASDDLVIHFPHYDKDPLGPASAILSGDLKLIRFWEDGSLHLFDLAHDLEESQDLVASRPADAAALAERLDAYLEAVGAQLPTPR